MSGEKKKKNAPVLRDEEDKKLYQKIYREGTVKFRISPEEASLIESMMLEEEYVNMSEFIRIKLFGKNVETSVRRRLKARDKWYILSEIKNQMRRLNADYRYVRQVMPKDIATAIANQNVKQLTELDRKWLAKLQESTEEVNNNLIAIMYALGIDREGPITNSAEDLWDDPEELKKARMIWEFRDSQEA